MRSDVKTVATHTPLAEVVRLLADLQVSGMPVTDEAGHIVGVLSMRDIVERYAEGESAGGGARSVRSFYQLSGDDEEAELEALDVSYDDQDRAEDVMTAQVHSVPVDMPLPRVASRMVELGVHRLLVEDSGQHVGLVSTMDVLRAVAEMG